MTVRLDGLRRGVAQPGRAPGSGPGGRRFKSSLPDHLFSVRYADSELLKIPAVGKNATVFASRVFQEKPPAGCLHKDSRNIFGVKPVCTDT
jgi:hypothetical protein